MEYVSSSMRHCIWALLMRLVLCFGLLWAIVWGELIRKQKRSETYHIPTYFVAVVKYMRQIIFIMSTSMVLIDPPARKVIDTDPLFRRTETPPKYVHGKMGTVLCYKIKDNAPNTKKTVIGSMA